MNTLEQLSQAVASGKGNDAKTLSQRALDEEICPSDIIDRALTPAMASVGERFRKNLIFVPEMLIAARAMKEAMSLLEPHFVSAGIVPKYTAVIGSVQGDLHDIGKNLVAIMWKGADFRIIDLGVNVPPAKFAAAVREHRPQLVGLSALLTTTLPAMVETVRILRAEIDRPVRIMIGGAPVTQQFADEIGADGYAPNAGVAVERAHALVGAT
ncbi:corrinoid protein [Synoicihabitans lomoniglobus]|uniref:Corrinoid protein n=1 Tax=Synoicihabitans lomoniglobus TaxID=2909285 RepID=A0AAF0A138_9BACT|nr:corrinoid protein [Opitutaceae bacterium LMO-M01]WED64717.1 corrinoid protein [Opitutaceae bacterium LMO-M01]